MSRYSRQELFAGIGPQGQARLRAARVLIVGCGALGSSLAEQMTRAGIGKITLIDRDFVEESNLQRQSLFDEDDVAACLPKAIAAERRLRRINSQVDVRGLVLDLKAEALPGLLEGVDLVLDGTDNFETRFLINDACVQARIPWIYGACVAATGLVLLVRPTATPCLRCVLEEIPAPGGPTCDTVGIIAPIVHIVASLQVAEALKLLTGHHDALVPGLISIDVWQGRQSVMSLQAMQPTCPACRDGRYDALRSASQETTLCGRGAVQISPARPMAGGLEALAARLAPLGAVKVNDYLLRFTAPEGELVVFADGRAIVKGIIDTAQARRIYTQYVGN
ncbi:MAG: ThiF family adenylyltransferase [Vicinamibacteria bacterium]|jgi:adenylyltransferase/sulfurtransferase|nr:ThiF family adenylyltransferase [Vicinamibacteria bacterium]